MITFANREVIGVLYLFFGLSNLWNLQYYLPVDSSNINFILVGNIIVALAAGFYFITNAIYLLTYKLAAVVSKSQYSWYATSVGFALWSTGYLIGSGCYYPSIFWGVWYASAAIIFSVMGYRRIFSVPQ